MRFVNAVTILLLSFVLTAPLLGDEWPQWRGAHRDGSVAESQIPQTWPDVLKKKWQITVGEGHASPVLSNGILFQFARQGDNETAMAIKPEDGEIIWKQSYSAPYKMNSAARDHGEGPKSTPFVDDKSFYTLGITGVLTSYDITSGKQNWRISSAEMFGETSPLYGTAMSPLVADGLCIAHLGGHDDGGLLAVDISSGKVRWKWLGDGPGYASPMLMNFAGQPQVVTFSQDNIIGVDIQTGALLWEMPFKTPYTQNAVTPLTIDDDVILSGLGQGIFRLRVTQENGKWKTTKLWMNKEIGSYMSTPVLHNGLIAAMSDKRKGLYVMLDPGSGNVLWQSKGREGENAALLHSGSYLMSLKTDGTFQVALQKDSQYEFLRAYQVSDSPTWAHPVIFDKKLFVKNKTDLILYDLK